MTDLKNGIIEIEGINLKPGVDISYIYDNSNEHFISFGKFTISPLTTKDDLLAVYGDKLSMCGSRFLRFKMIFRIEEKLFGCSFWFNDNGSISKVEISPCIQYKSEQWDRTGMQEERRQFCDAWLFERLGEPHKKINGDIEYTLLNSKVSCFSNFDIHNGADAGYIVIEYLK